MTGIGGVKGSSRLIELPLIVFWALPNRWLDAGGLNGSIRMSSGDREVANALGFFQDAPGVWSSRVFGLDLYF